VTLHIVKLLAGLSIAAGLVAIAIAGAVGNWMAACACIGVCCWAAIAGALADLAEDTESVA
jgi:hypothetical protein